MKTILIQLDTDAHPSTFDRVVAVDAGVDHLFSYGGVHPENVTALIHGAMFTRGPADLKNTAIFVGGSQVQNGELLLQRIEKTFFGPMRVSTMMDSNGCNTTAAAAVATARSRLSLAGTRATVLGATGPVGIRAAQLLALEQAVVRVVSRTLDRAAAACEQIRREIPSASLEPVAAADEDGYLAACNGAELLIAAGAAGVCFLPKGKLECISHLKMAIDLNAVPPVGIADISPMDKAVEKAKVLCYGALGVGGLKMKVHKQAVRSLFESSQQRMNTQEIYQLALAIASPASAPAAT